MARCAERGDLTLADLTGPGSAPTLSCRVPVGDHYEGALLLDRQRVVGAARDSTVVTVGLRPGSGGAWAVGLLEPLFPDRIRPANVRGSRLDGFTSPGGGRIPVTVPSDCRLPRALFVTVVCVRDVRLELTLDGRAAGVVVCDDAHVEALRARHVRHAASRSWRACGAGSGCRSTCGRSAGRPTSGPSSA